MSRRAGVRVRATKRITLIPRVLRVNVNVPAFLRALADGPGGQRVRDALSWTYGWLGVASVNSRTGRATWNSPGLGSVSAPVHSTQAQRKRKRQQRSGQ